MSTSSSGGGLSSHRVSPAFLPENNWAMSSRAGSKVGLNNASSDEVVVHCFGRAKIIPHPSPFVLKLETYLRMVQIPYQIDTKKPFGANGKMPWITYKNDNVTDSQLIIEYLNKKFDKNLWGNDINNEQKAIARCFRVTFEEHFFWGIAHWRFVKDVDSLGKLLALSKFKLTVGKLIVPRKVKKGLDAQGLGRHPYETIVELVSRDLRDFATVLGDKKFFCGPEPTEVDAAFFGMLAQAVWGTPGSPYEALIKNELKNVLNYCQRMKDLYWNDWDNLLVK